MVNIKYILLQSFPILLLTMLSITQHRSSILLLIMVLMGPMIECTHGDYVLTNSEILATINTTCKQLNMTVCAIKCISNCRTYTTPIGCYSPRVMFPGDPQWGTSDIYDEYINSTIFKRYFYSSENSSCFHETDSYLLPFHECVGPFGKPRPWGEFLCIVLM